MVGSRGAFALVFLLASSARAEEERPVQGPPTAHVMSLPEALEYARSHQPDIRAAHARIEAERAQARIPRGQWTPQVGVTAQVLGATENNTSASYFPVNTVDLPRIGGTRSKSASTATFQPYASTLAGIGINQEVFDFGRIAAQSAAADAVIDVRRQDAAATKLDIELNVEEAYFAVQAAKGVLVASNGAVERARVHRDLARAGVTAGLRSPIELTRAESDLQRFEIGSIRARGGVAVAQSVLAASIGSPEPSIDAGAAPASPAEMPALPNAIRMATTRDPRILATLARLKAQEQTTKAIGAELRPNLGLSATFAGRAGGAPISGGEQADASGWLPSVPNYDVGLVLSWPLLDGTISARKDASHAQEQVRKEEMAVAQQAVVAAVQQAYVQVDVARTALPGLQRAVDAAIANYAQADARFKAGLGTSVELADAEALRATTEIDLATGTFDLARARAGFGRAIAEGF